MLFDIPVDSARGLRLEDLPRYGQLVPGEVRAALFSLPRETTWRCESAPPALSADIGRLEFSVVRLDGGEENEAETLLVIRDGAPIHPATEADTPESLEGPIAICAHCKSLSMGPGIWQTVETYVAEHSGSSCRQEMCPTCVRMLYPELCKNQPPSPAVEAT